MRVLVVSPRAAAGGAESLLRLAADGLSRRWERFHVVFFEPGVVEAELRAIPGVTTEVLPAGRLREPARVARTMSQLRSRLVADRFDRALAWMPKAQIYLGPAAWRAGVPAIWWQHGMPAPPSLLDRAASLLPAAAVLCPSEVAAAAQRRVGRLPVRVVAPGIADLSPDRERSAELRRRWLGDGEALALCVGRIQPSKGQHVLVEAVRLLADRLPELRWVVAGAARTEDAAYQDGLTAKLARWGLADRVAWVGERGDIASVLAACDVLVQPSFGESFGMAIVEAMNLELPVVSTDCGGPRDLVREGRTGRLVPVADASALAAAVAELAGSAELRRAWGQAGRKFQQERHSLGAYLDALDDAVRADS